MTHEEMWYTHYDQLVKYKEEYGNSDVPAAYVTDNGFLLGSWLYVQRNFLNDSKKRQLLTDLGIKWDLKREKWDDMYHLLEEYYDEHGSSDVPFTYFTYDELPLGTWLARQRKAYKERKNNILSLEQIAMLNDLDIDWGPNDTYLLNQEIVDYKQYRRVMLERMKHILEDISYEVYSSIKSRKNQATIEQEIIKRMWR